MIINNTHLELLMPRKRQEEEIQRIKDAPVGSILYTIGTSDNTDVIDTLIDKTGITYYTTTKDFQVRFVKSS